MDNDPKRGSRGVSTPELLIAMIIGSILTAAAIPAYNAGMTGMRLNATAGAISGAVSGARYRAIMNSQIYTITFTAPGNTYVVKNIATNTSAAPVPLPTPLVAVNGGTAATYVYTLCPNGTVFGAGGTCPNANSTPALVLTYKGREIDLSVSGAGNVTTKTVK